MLSFIGILTRLPSFPLFAFYLINVLTWRIWGKSLPRLNLNKLMTMHNFICITLSGLTFLGLTWFLGVKSDSLFSRTPHPTLSKFLQIYWFTKLFELLDTFYMMLRKRARQVSFLHVYHHSAMLILSDYAFRISPWPCMAFPLALNSLVHVFVYGYYLISAFMQISDVYKRFLTKIQILQFSLGLVFCSVGYLYHGFCIYSILFGLTMLLLFGNFYYRAYCLKAEKCA